MAALPTPVTPSPAKYKFSLKSLPRIKTPIEQAPVKISLDLEQIKREIMNEMKEKNKTSRVRKYWHTIHYLFDIL